jgi:hypothetical protein
MQASLSCEQPFPPVTWIAEAAGTAIEKPNQVRFNYEESPPTNLESPWIDYHRRAVAGFAHLFSCLVP